MEAAKVAICELRDGVVARQAEAKVLMYIDDAANEEPRITATAVVATGTMAWLLVDDDETEVEADDNDEEAEAEHVAEAEAAERETAKWAAHWSAEMDKTLTYRWDVDRRDVARREAARRPKTEHRQDVLRWRLSTLSAPPATATEPPAVGRRRRWLRSSDGGHVATTSP
jgi:hypothetical protein